MLSLEDGRAAVKLARDAILQFLQDEQGSGKSGDAGRTDRASKTDKTDTTSAAGLPAVFSEKRGVFVTLKGHPSGELRGCIGFPRPFASLAEGIAEAAVYAATQDPRFNPVSSDELDGLVLEVSVLTQPTLVDCESPEERLKRVKVGRDGLIIQLGQYSGLLLPQVAVEEKWNEEEFLCHACRKAGLPADAWRAPGVKLSCFQAQVFGEETPGGIVREEKLC